MNRDLHIQFLAEIRQDIRKLEEEISRLRGVEKYHVEKAGEPKQSADEDDPVGQKDDATADGQKAPTKPYANSSVWEAAQDVLRQAGEELSTRLIADKILEGGYPTTNAEDFRNQVFGVLSNKSKLFEKTGPGMWKLREYPIEGEEPLLR